MKRILSIACCCLLLMVAATSCVKKEYVENNNTKTIPFTTTSTSWKTTDGGRNWTTILDVAEIDSYLNTNGGILVYLSYDNGAHYEQLPEVYNGISYSYEHAIGSIAITAQAYNSTAQITNPGNTLVKVVLIDSAP